jgi:hypothetical protein
MALQSSGAISLGNIQTEFGGSNPIGLNEYQSTVGQSSGNNISISDFYGLSNVVHSSTVVTGYQASQYFSVSGYNGGSFGSMSNLTISSLNGKANVPIIQCVRTGSAGSEKLTLRVNKNNETIANAGFTSIKIYMNQSSAGTVTITRNRTAAAFTFASGSGTWTWDDVTLAQAFGSTVGQTNFMELV